MPLQQVRRLGFCKQTASWPDAVMGPGHFAKIHSSARAARRNSEAIRMAHVSTYVLDSPAQCGNRVQSDAGTVAAFNSAIHAGCLHPGTRASQTCSSGSDLLDGVFGRSKWNATDVGTKMTLQGEGKSTETKRDTNKGTKTCPFGSSIVSGEFVQLFWNEWRGRRDSNSRPLP